jgi:hypothetical protein
MMKEIASLMVLLVLCIPALAVDITNMVGNWTGTAHGLDWLTNSNYQTTGKAIYWDEKYTIVIDEQNGTRFAGKMFPNANPLNLQVILGIVGSDNKTIAMVDDSTYFWGSMKSPTEMELFGSVVDIKGTTVGAGTFSKAT